jgi:hypothetical protein
LIKKLNDAANLIFFGRIGRRTHGQTEQGLEDFEQGLILAMQVFDEALISGGLIFGGLIPRPLGRLKLGVQGICSPAYAMLPR